MSKFPRSYSEYSYNFFQNLNKYNLKVILFSNFRCIFSTVPLSLIEILSNFLQISEFFFKHLLIVSIKWRLNFVQIFIPDYLKIFMKVSDVFLIFFFLHKLFFYKYFVSNLVYLNFILCLIKLFTKIPVFSKFIPKFHKFHLKFCQTLPKNFLYNLRFFELLENFLENLLKILLTFLLF